MAMLGVLAVVVLMLSAFSPVSDGHADAGARHALIAVRQRAALTDASREARHAPAGAMEGAEPRLVATSLIEYPYVGAVVPAAADSTGAAAPSSPVFEATVPVDPPATLEPILTSDSAVIAPPQCHARAHTEYDGIAVKCEGQGIASLRGAAAVRCATAIPSTRHQTSVRRWGDKNVLPDAAACCASCDQHAREAEAAVAKAPLPCNAWVFCADAEVSMRCTC